MKKMVILAISMITFVSCATIRYSKNYEIWYPGKVAQKNQLKGKMSNGCEVIKKRIYKYGY